MYHFPNQPLFHQNGYQNQCSLFDHGVHEPVAVAHPHPYIPSSHYDTALNEISTEGTAPRQPQHQPPPDETVNTKKKVTNKTSVDTSSFSIEERLVAAVWVHERKRTRSSMSQIKQEFRQRFGREPPAKNTLLVWERKLFSTGSVCDAPRPGRPVNRQAAPKEKSEGISNTSHPAVCPACTSTTPGTHTSAWLHVNIQPRIKLSVTLRTHKSAVYLVLGAAGRHLDFEPKWDILCRNAIRSC